jgi:hypothetical protein
MFRVVVLTAVGVFASIPVQAQAIITVAGSGASSNFCGDGGAATKACLALPSDVALDTAGNLFIADYENARVRKVDKTGMITTVAGNGTRGFCPDGGPAIAACLGGPAGIAIDAADNLFIADSGRIRKVDAAGTITTVAGNGSAGYCGDGGSATSACLNDPQGITVDAAGNLFIADALNHRVRKVDHAGTITTVAGNGTSAYCGDGGPATSACLSAPYGVALNAAGNLFVADAQNHRIRRIDATGTITTIAGTGVGDYCGDGALASTACLYYPERLAFDAENNLFIGDYGNSRVRKIDAIGTITTVAGSDIYGYCGDGGIATDACLASPRGVALDAGALIIADERNARIRKVDVALLTHPTPSLSGCLKTTGELTIGAPAPSGGMVVALSSDNVNVAVPATVTIKSGELSRRFYMRTTAVPSDEIATISAAGTDWTRTIRLRLTPMGPKLVTLSPNPVVGGGAVEGIVTLECAAGPGEITVTLTSSKPAVAMPTPMTLTIPFGVESHAFTVTTVPVAQRTTVAIKATANLVTKSKKLTVNPGQ